MLTHSKAFSPVMLYFPKSRVRLRRVYCFSKAMVIFTVLLMTMSCILAQSVQCAADLYKEEVWDLRNQPSQAAWLALAASSGATFSSSGTQERWME